MLGFKIAIFLLTVIVPQHHCTRHHDSHHNVHLIKVLKSRNNFFRQLSKTTEKVVNGIFDSLNLSEQFSMVPNIKTLLTMNHDFKGIAEKNFKLFDILRNASAVQVDDKPINQIRIIELIIKVINKNDFNVNNETENEHFETRTKSFTPEFANSKEFKTFIGGFISKLNHLTLNDLFPKNAKVKSSEEKIFEGNTVLEPPSHQGTELYKMENRRLYRGEKTSITSYPFVVSVHVKGEFTCAGSIIGYDLVITAASCLKLQHDTYVRLNSDYYSRLGDLIPVLEIYIYPQYDSKLLHHNLAILRLQRSLKTNKISLDRKNLNLLPNAEITILGWGAMMLNQTGNQNEKLEYDILKPYDIIKCKEIYSKMYVTESNFCADFKTRGNGACPRDVGGPGIIDNLLLGIVSFAAPVCGDPDAPTVFTRVGFYTKWIDYVMSLRPTKRDTEPNMKSEDNFLIYHRTPLPRSYARVNMANKYQISDKMNKNFKVNDDDAQKDIETTAVLRQIINAMNNKNQMLYDIINDDLYDDFVKIFKNDDEDILHHPLINKTH